MSHDGNNPYAIDPEGQGQIMYFLVNASPPKLLGITTSNFVGA